jgi:hypothetical protein
MQNQQFYLSRGERIDESDFSPQAEKWRRDHAKKQTLVDYSRQFALGVARDGAWQFDNDGSLLVYEAVDVDEEKQREVALSVERARERAASIVASDRARSLDAFEADFGDDQDENQESAAAPVAPVADAEPSPAPAREEEESPAAAAAVIDESQEKKLTGLAELLALLNAAENAPLPAEPAPAAPELESHEASPAPAAPLPLPDPLVPESETDAAAVASSSSPSPAEPVAESSATHLAAHYMSSLVPERSRASSSSAVAPALGSKKFDDSDFDADAEFFAELDRKKALEALTSSIGGGGGVTDSAPAAALAHYEDDECSDHFTKRSAAHRAFLSSMPRPRSPNRAARIFVSPITGAMYTEAELALL